MSVGGSNNAYTTNDITNYHCVVPVSNFETALWLESDRMLGLAFNQNSLDVQKKVVIEEFKERYLNKPYGDAWLKFRELSYKVHPYRWSTIGRDLSHIEKVTLSDIKDFFYKNYLPNNAILVVAGGVSEAKALDLVEKWFGNIPSGDLGKKNFLQEPKQTEARYLELTGDVPFNAIMKVFHTCERTSENFYPTELLTSIISEGTSSRLYSILVDDKEIFSNIYAYTTESMDPGSLIVYGVVSPDYSIESAEKSLNEVLQDITIEGVLEKEVEKAKNNYITSQEFNYLSLLNRAEDLALCTLLGNTNLINENIDIVKSVSKSQIDRVAQVIFSELNSSTIFYRKNMKN